MDEQMNRSSQYGGNTSRRMDDPQRRKRRRRRRIGTVFGTIFKVLGTLLLIGIATGGLLLCFAAVYIQTVIMPEARKFDLSDFSVGQNSIMYYTDPATGQEKELVTLLSSTDATWVTYEEMPKNLINAAIAIEDKRFWSHPGVDWRRTGKAVLLMFTGQDIQGGSTITQQLIKNLTQYDETTVKRKIIEIFRALEFTKDHSKEETITWYLNYIFLGSKCQGVGAAAQKYFNKSVQDLSLAECASLVAITNNPSIYGPYSPIQMENKEGEVWNGRQWNKYRQELTLGLMLEQGLITQREYNEAMAEELQFARGVNEEAPTELYTWYEEAVISDVQDDLQEQYGWSTKYISTLLSSGGLSIYTCVNPEVQAIAEEIYGNIENLDYVSKKSGQRLQSAITIIDNETGDVAGIEGRIGEKTGNRVLSLATDGSRQPGSSIKPLSVYGPALDMGIITPYSVIDDYPHHIEGGKAWPVNVDGRYRGRVTVQQAVAQSYNTVAVRVVADLLSPQNSYNYMEEKFHIDLVEALDVNGKINSDIDTAPLSMGGLTQGVSTREMANAYATFPNMGIYRRARTYTVVKDSNGNILLDNTREDEPALKEKTAYYINELLKNVVSNGGGTEARLSGMTTAGKTGTTDSKYDRWFVGYTPYYTAAVWVGFDKVNERVPLSGNPAAQMWKKVMAPIHENLENKQFPSISGLTGFTYCLDSGLKATEFCQIDPRSNRAASGTLHQDDTTSEVCTFHTADSVVEVCMDCPVLNGDGEPIAGLYHLAGEFCPEESRKRMCYPNYEREKVGNASAPDEAYRLENVLEHGECTLHTEEGLLNDPRNRNSPNYDPRMDPNSPLYDPSYVPEDPNGTGNGNGNGTGNGTDPGTTPDPDPVTPPPEGPVLPIDPPPAQEPDPPDTTTPTPDEGTDDPDAMAPPPGVPVG